MFDLYYVVFAIIFMIIIDESRFGFLFGGPTVDIQNNWRPKGFKRGVVKNITSRCFSSGPLCIINNEQSLIKCGSGICNRCDQRLSVLTFRFFRLAKASGTNVENSRNCEKRDFGSVRY
jgi:hypothetical protein